MKASVRTQAEEGQQVAKRCCHTAMAPRTAVAPRSPVMSRFRGCRDRNPDAWILPGASHWNEDTPRGSGCCCQTYHMLGFLGQADIDMVGNCKGLT